MKKCSTPQWTKRRPTPTPERVGDYSAGPFISGNFVTFIIRPFHSNTYEVLRYTLKSTWYQWLPVVPRLVIIHSLTKKELFKTGKQVTPKQPSSSFLALYFLVTKTPHKRNARVARHKSAPFRSAPLSPTLRWRTRWFSRRRRRRRRHGERRCRGDADDARVVVLREVVNYSSSSLSDGGGIQRRHSSGGSPRASDPGNDDDAHDDRDDWHLSEQPQTYGETASRLANIVRWDGRTRCRYLDLERDHLLAIGQLANRDCKDEIAEAVIRKGEGKRITEESFRKNITQHESLVANGERWDERVAQIRLR